MRSLLLLHLVPMLEYALRNGLEVDHSGAHYGAVTVVCIRVHEVMLVRQAAHCRYFLAMDLMLLIRILV